MPAKTSPAEDNAAGWNVAPGEPLAPIDGGGIAAAASDADEMSAPASAIAGRKGFN